MEGDMNEKNDCDDNLKEDIVVDQVDCISRDEVVWTLNKIKTGRAPRPSDVSLELIAASR